MADGEKFAFLFWDMIHIRDKVTACNVRTNTEVFAVRMDVAEN